MPDSAFHLEEATIDELHAAIRAGKITVVEVVQRYIDRVRAYNGVSSMLVTEDGATVLQAPGVVRGKQPLKFPTQTLKASSILPDLDKYQGPPLGGVGDGLARNVRYGWRMDPSWRHLSPDIRNCAALRPIIIEPLAELA